MTVAEAINGYAADNETKTHVKDIAGLLEDLKNILNKIGVLELTFAEIKNNGETLGKVKDALKDLVMKRGFCIREYIVYIRQIVKSSATKNSLSEEASAK